MANSADCRPIRRLLLGALVSIPAALVSLVVPSGQSGAQAASGPKRVVGTLVLRLPDPNEKTLDVDLPDRTVILRNVDGPEVAHATTALNGSFELIAPSPGAYQVCWNLAGDQGCGNRIIVKDATASAGLVRASVGKPIVYGVAMTGDGRPCWMNDSFFDVNFSTKVTGGGVTTLANTKGEYALIGVAPGTFRVTARCETTTAGAKVSLGAVSIRTDISLGNHVPRLTVLSVDDGGKGVTRATSSTVVNLISGVHAGPNPVEFVWRAAPNAGLLSGGAGPTQQWVLPRTLGLNTAYVLARDGKGGVAYNRIDLEVGAKGIDLSGRVVDEQTMAPIPGATVTIGTGPINATTNAFGWFNLRTKPDKTDRYVLNIQHPDYALLSRVTDRSAEGNTYPLTRAQVTMAPSDQTISVVDQWSGGPCGSREQGRKLRRLVEPTVWQEPEPFDPKAAVALRKAEAEALRQWETLSEEHCDRRGAEVRIPANALLDETNVPYTGSVRVAMTTLDPGRRSIPGDYRATTSGGKDAELLSFGALDLRLTDPAGHRLHLQPGAMADVVVPAFTLDPSTAPPSIATWSYDESTGFWREDSKATLQNTPQGPAYIGQTSHFSTLNMDVAGNDPAHATCVRFEVDSAFNVWSNLTIRAYVSYGGTNVKVKETPLDSAQYHAIYRIPYDTGTPNTLRLELRGRFNGVNEILLDNIIATDARPKMTGTNLWPPYPYAECGDSVLLTPAPGVVPNWGEYDASNRPAFLGGPFGQFNPPDGAAQAAAYYAAVDPGSTKTTLGDWWLQNGFGADGLGACNASYVRQAYLNFNDLGSGRDMHCIQNGAKRACYVTNYGLPDQNPANADAAETLASSKRGATVAMEFDNTATLNSTTDERVQFFVFNNGVASSQRIEFADLDGLGPKPVPFVCMVCHGGQPSLTAGHKANYSRFREFDLPSFHYSGGRTWDFGQGTLTGSELDNFAKLNQVAHDAPIGSAISDLVDRWYTGGTAGGPPPASPNPPSGWSTNVSGYHSVYGKSCRTCHIARDEGDTGAYFVFAHSGDFDGTSYAVCGGGNPKRRVMPNAFVTYKNFWADSAGVQLYETMIGVAAGACGN
jgi:hypothetical protein